MCQNRYPVESGPLKVDVLWVVKGGGLFYRISNFTMPSMSAMGVKFATLPKLFGLITKFDKAAVLTDESWIATASSIEGALIPGLEIKPFGLEEEGAAMAYLRGA